METLIITVLGMSYLLLALLAWLLICNDITYRQRNRLLDKRPHGCLFKAYSREFRKVSYEKHLLYLFFLRNPKHLYGLLNRSLWKRR